MFLNYIVTYGNGYGDNTSSHSISDNEESVSKWVSDTINIIKKKYDFDETRDTIECKTKNMPKKIVRGFVLYFNWKPNKPYKGGNAIYFDLVTKFNIEVI